MTHAYAAKSLPLCGLSPIGFLCICVQRPGRTCADVREWVSGMRRQRSSCNPVASDLIGENPDPQAMTLFRGSSAASGVMFRCLSHQLLICMRPMSCERPRARAWRMMARAPRGSRGGMSFRQWLTHQGSRPDSVFAMARTSPFGYAVA